MAGDEHDDCVLRARGIHRAFPGVRALDDVSLCLRSGEIHALMGQNGAGKSTLIKVLTGVCAADSGSIELDGQIIHPLSPLHAQQLGISTVFQEVNLCPNLTVAENIFAGRYPRQPWWRGGGIDWTAVDREARRLLGAMQLDIDVTRLLSAYPVAVQQMVRLRATAAAARVLILMNRRRVSMRDEVKQPAPLKRLRGQEWRSRFMAHFRSGVCDRRRTVVVTAAVGECRG